MSYITIIALILSVISILYYCYGIYAGHQFFSQKTVIDPDFHPPITILKPLCGLDFDTYENLWSCCEQDYPQYQVIFSVKDSHDPSREIVEKLINQFPDIDIELVISDRTIGANLKVSNLNNALTKAKYDILIIADSDIRVNKDYLKTIIQPLKQENVGVVTCLYRSVGDDCISSIESLPRSTEFYPSVLVAKHLQGIDFAFGATIVMRKQVLEKIGGFKAIADYLADDYLLGNLPANLGYDVVLSDYIVDHVLGKGEIKSSIQRLIRWDKCAKVSKFWGYLGLIFTYGTLHSLLFLIVSDFSMLGWSILMITWGMRLIMAWFVGIKHIEDAIAKKWFWFIPIRDLISVAFWCYSFISNQVIWRGQKMRLVSGGKLELL